MQYERIGEGRYRCGDSLIVIAEQGKVEHRGAPWRGRGYRYTTVQVFDCVAEYEGIWEKWLGKKKSGGEMKDEPKK